MPDALLLEELTYTRYNIMRGQACRFVDIEDTVHPITFQEAPSLRDGVLLEPPYLQFQFCYNHRHRFHKWHMQRCTSCTCMTTTTETQADGGCIIRCSTAQAQPSQVRLVITLEESRDLYTLNVT